MPFLKLNVSHLKIFVIKKYNEKKLSNQVNQFKSIKFQSDISEYRNLHVLINISYEILIFLLLTNTLWSFEFPTCSIIIWKMTGADLEKNISPLIFRHFHGMKYNHVFVRPTYQSHVSNFHSDIACFRNVARSFCTLFRETMHIMISVSVPILQTYI